MQTAPDVAAAGASASPAARVVIRVGAVLGHPAIVPGLLIAAAAFVVWQVVTVESGFPYAVYDTHSYWLAGGSDHPYAATIASGFDDTVNLYKYRYPPPLAQLFAPFSRLPFPLVAGLWVAMLFGVFLVIAGRWAPVLLLFPPTLAELYLGNVNLLIALAIVVGFRRPAAWALVLLTKTTPGIGLLWFVFRREWRALGVAALTTGVVAVVSYLLAPQWWSEFREAMTVQAPAALDVPTAAIQVSLPIRLVAVVPILWFAARTDRAWIVPVAATLAAPAIWWNVLVILLAAVPLAEGRGLARPLLDLRLRRSAAEAI